MARHAAYLSKKDRFNYLIDHCETTLRLMYSEEFYASRFSKLEISGRGRFVRDLQRTGEKIIIRHNNGFYFVEVNVGFRFNAILHHFYKEALGFKRLSSNFRWGDNVIPSELRVALNEQGIGIPQVRQQGLNMFFTHIQKVRKEMAEFTQGWLGLHVATDKIRWNLEVLEICHDILTPAGIELADDKEIERKFNEAIDRLKKDCRYQENGRVATVPLLSESLTDAWRTSGDKEPRALQGYYNWDKSVQRLYIKEVGPRYAINRIERRFEERPCMLKHFAGNTIHSEEDFVSKVNALAKAAFPKHYEILSGTNHYSDKTKMKILKAACKQHCGHKNWYTIYLELKRKGTIHTGGATDRGVARKVAEILRKGILFRRKAPGVIVPDWEWLLSKQ